MELYILKSSACLLTLFTFYKLFLERENMHIFKRSYLLATLILAFTIPLITFTSYVEIPTQLISNTTSSVIFESQNSQPEAALTNYLPIILGSIYGLGVLFFGIKFVHNLLQLGKKIKQNPKQKENYFTNVLLNDMTNPHTFFNYIFLNKLKFETRQIPQEVFWHEQSHAKQKHTLDIIFIELLQVVFWFNPLIYFIKHAIKLNHEFLADQAVLNRGISTSIYQKTLLAFSTNTGHPQLTNAINYSSIKKRFTIMKTQTSQKAIWLRSIILLPLLAILIFSFSTKTVVEKELQQIENESEKINNTNKGVTMYSIENATAEQIAEYNTLAKKYNSQPKNNRQILKKEVEKLHYIYDLMSVEQRRNSEPFPNFPLPPEAPQVTVKPVAPITAIKVSSPKSVSVSLTPEAPAAPEVSELPSVSNKIELTVPPPPPPVESPLDHIIRMAKKNAAFIYNGKTISSDEAIDIMKKNKKMNIQTKESNTEQPKVYLFTEPIVIETDE